MGAGNFSQRATCTRALERQVPLSPRPDRPAGVHSRRQRLALGGGRGAAAQLGLEPRGRARDHRRGGPRGDGVGRGEQQPRQRRLVARVLAPADPQLAARVAHAGQRVGARGVEAAVPAARQLGHELRMHGEPGAEQALLVERSEVGVGVAPAGGSPASSPARRRARADDGVGGLPHERVEDAVRQVPLAQQPRVHEHHAGVEVPVRRGPGKGRAGG